MANFTERVGSIKKHTFKGVHLPLGKHVQVRNYGESSDPTTYLPLLGADSLLPLSQWNLPLVVTGLFYLLFELFYPC